MALEIERKFLINSNDFKKQAYKKTYIIQGFLNSNKKRIVRVRIVDGKGFLTIKGKSNKIGITRFEWEKEIEKKDAEILLKMCKNNCIEKNRFLIKKGKHIFEVDEFLGKNKGLIIAEIELNFENEKFFIPYWLGKEITGIIKYYNSELSKKPFTKWS